jgi:hypothetical protein
MFSLPILKLRCCEQVLASAHWRNNCYDVSLFQFRVEALQKVDVFAVYEKGEEILHLSLLVVDVFSEFFAVFFRKQSQQFLNSDDVLQLDFVHLLAGYLPQRSEELDFDFHLFSIPIFRGRNLFYSMPQHFFTFGSVVSLACLGRLNLNRAANSQISGTTQLVD